MLDPLASDGPRFESDLRAAREAQGVTIDAVHRETRMTTDVIGRFESGRLLDDPLFGPVYLRAFLKQYAVAIGVPPQAVLDAYEAQKEGRYRGALRPGGPLPEPPRPSPAPPPEPSSGPESPSAPGFSVTSELAPAPPERQALGASSPTAAPARPAASPPAPPHAASPPRAAVSPSAPVPASPPGARPPGTVDLAPAVTALRESAPHPDRPVPPPLAPAPQRVRPAGSGAPGRSLDRAWGTILGLAAVAVLLIGSVLYFLFRDETPLEADPALAVAADTAASDTADAPTAAAPAGPPLAPVIRVEVVAADGALRAFRLQAGDDERRPYWLEQGSARVVEDSAVVLIWGNWQREDGVTVTHTIPPAATLRMQGFEWKPGPAGPLRIDRVRGQRILDSLAALGTGAAPADADAAAPAPAAN